MFRFNFESKLKEMNQSWVEKMNHLLIRLWLKLLLKLPTKQLGHQVFKFIYLFKQASKLHFIWKEDTFSSFS